MIARLDLLRHELRLAARSLSRNAVFVITSVLSLALGIGASAAAFSVLDAVRFRALPFPHGERLQYEMGRAYGVPTIAFRYFNVYGTRQALSNPYTGVCAIFCSRLLNDHAPLIFDWSKFHPSAALSCVPAIAASFAVGLSTGHARQGVAAAAGRFPWASDPFSGCAIPAAYPCCWPRG